MESKHKWSQRETIRINIIIEKPMPKLQRIERQALESK